MSPEEISDLTIKLRTLRVVVKTLATITQYTPIVPEGLVAMDPYQLMLTSIHDVIVDWEFQVTSLENRFLTL